MEAPVPMRSQGSVDKVQTIGQQHPCLGIDQPLLPGRAASIGQSKISFGLQLR
jgi:hypothetical protein